MRRKSGRENERALDEQGCTQDKKGNKYRGEFHGAFTGGKVSPARYSTLSLSEKFLSVT